MKKHLWKWMAAVLTAALLLCVLIFPASGSSSIYLMAVNDKVVKLPIDNMPLVSGSQLYIPYTTLSSDVTGINLGVRAKYNSSRGTLTVTNGQQTVTFDIRKNTANDAWGTEVDARALIRNSMAYLPIGWLCSYFDSLKYSLSSTPYGTLVRLTNDAVVLDDAEFIDAATDNLRQVWEDYQKNLTPSSPATSPSTPPSPSPSTSTVPEPEPVVYLAFRWSDRAAEVADVLERYGQQALFFFAPNELVNHDDLVRRLVGQGHQVGLTLTGSDSSSCLAQLTAGRQLLADIARCSALIFSADELDDEGKSALREAGCALWEPTVQADGLTQSALLRALSSSAPNYVELTCDESGLSLITSALRTLSGSGYRLRQALAPVL